MEVFPPARKEDGYISVRIIQEKYVYQISSPLSQ
jgi:hypothetical protein